MSDIQISAKTLGELAMPGFCPRCFWLKRHLKGGLPFQIFPGIFSSVDSYVKKAVHTWFDKHGAAPSWMPEISDAVRYLPALHYTKFRFKEPVSGIVLSGMVDDLFELESLKRAIIDYKMARFTAYQDSLLPIYEVQLNAYALIEESLGGTVDRLLLTYCEPKTDESACTDDIYCDEGFDMGFTIKSLPIDINPENVVDLLVKARNIIDLERPPERTCGCKDCQKMDNLLALAA